MLLIGHETRQTLGLPNDLLRAVTENVFIMSTAAYTDLRMPGDFDGDDHGDDSEEEEHIDDVKKLHWDFFKV